MCATPRNEPPLRIVLAGAVITFALVAGAIGVWFDASGIQQTRWSDSPTFLLVSGAVAVLLGAGAVVAWFRGFGRRAGDGFTLFLGGAALGACLLSLLMAMLFANVRLDPGPGEPVEFLLTDRFTLEVQRRDMQRPFVRHYAAFAVPEELRNHALVLLRPEGGRDRAVGQTLRATRHPGFFALPWYEFTDPVGGARDQCLERTFRDFEVLAATGVFAPRSPYREQLQQRGVPVVEK